MTDLTKPISASNPAPSRGVRRDAEGNEVLPEKKKGRVKTAKAVDPNNHQPVNTDEVEEDIIEGNLTEPVEEKGKPKSTSRVVSHEPASNKGGQDAGVSK